MLLLFLPAVLPLCLAPPAFGAGLDRVLIFLGKFVPLGQKLSVAFYLRGERRLSGQVLHLARIRLHVE